jgi:hypothetical protein
MVIRVMGRFANVFFCYLKVRIVVLFRQIGHLSSQIGHQIGQRADNNDQNED